MHTRSPLCRSGFTGFSWQFISLSLWLSSGVHTKHIALSSPKPYSLDSLSTSISTLAVFSPLFFTLAAHDFPTPPTLAHSSRFHLSVLCFSPLPLFRITPPTPPPLYPPAPHQFPPLHLFSSGLVSLSLSPVNISLSFILHSSGPSSHPHPPSTSAASRYWIPLTFLGRSLDFCLTSRDIQCVFMQCRQGVSWGMSLCFKADSVCVCVRAWVGVCQVIYWFPGPEGLFFLSQQRDKLSLWNSAARL